MNRFEPTPQQKTEILSRYNFECAACVTKDELYVDVAHLFEDATTSRPRLDRLIVLCSNCNQAEARSHYIRKPDFLMGQGGDFVASFARKRYWMGNYSGAYQSSRFAAYLFEKQGFYAKSLECLVDAISALRPIRWGDFLTATLLEVERLCSSHHNISLIQRWLCLDRFALVLFDYRRWSESAAVLNASGKLRSGIRADLRDHEQLTFDLASSFRRVALIKACTGTLCKGETLDKLVGKLLEDAQEFKHLSRFDAYATNLDVAGKIVLEIGQNCEVAHLYSQQALELLTKIKHKWVLQEIRWRDAEYYFMKKDRKKTLENVVEALRVFLTHPVVLEPTLSAIGPAPHNFLEDLSRYNISMDELREHGVAPSSNPPGELLLDLPEHSVDQIVKSLLRQ